MKVVIIHSQRNHSFLPGGTIGMLYSINQVWQYQRKNRLPQGQLLFC